MGGIFYLSHQPGASLKLPDLVLIDKIVHCIVYSVLGLCLIWALPRKWWGQRPLLARGGVVLFCLLYGISDEFHQSFIPDRFASGWDLVADTIGGIIALLWLPVLTRLWMPDSASIGSKSELSNRDSMNK